MKKIFRTALYGLVGAALLLPGTGLAADVCSQGVGIPPFLSSGARPNLLMVLDNSGSMLDAAYSKSGTLVDANGSPIISGKTELTYQRCLDGDYDITEHDNKGNEIAPPLATVVGYEDGKTYGGYFQNDQWYQWQGKTGNYAYSSWESGKAYTAGNRVFDYGNIYEAASDGTSTGETIDKDTEITWNHVFYLPRWANKTVYDAGSFVWYENQLYYTGNGGTSNDADDTDGLKLSDDTGITDWTAVDSTWRAKSYTKDDIVTYKGIYYQALSDVGSNDTKPGEDNGAKWQSLRQGAFEEIDSADACSGATGTKYEKSNALCLTINETVTPKKVTSFAARGNFLNWAMASKFDIEKKILTGGKFNYDEKVMVAEHRGCSGSRFVKQVKLDGGKFLSLGVRGSKYSADDVFMRDRIDTTDDTTRLEILAITDAGFKPSAECQEMIDTITTKEQSGANWSSAITACLDTFPNHGDAITHQRPMLNHSLQFCSKVDTDNLRDVSVIENECGDLYRGIQTANPAQPPYDPSGLKPEFGAYICFGIYDSALSPAERAGYVGRCWKPATGVTKTCQPQPASEENICTDYPCPYTKTESNKEYIYLNEIPEGGTVAYVYKCTKTAANTGKDDGFGCTKADGDIAGSRDNWALQYMWKKSNGVYEGTCTGPNDVASDTTPADWENADDSAAVEECIIQASIDYCNDTSVPEVIDPSDQAGDTAKTWNIPGVLTDSQILVQLGGNYPLSVMKGYIEEPDRPDGVMQSVARDLRLGLMSFNNVGAATECSADYLTDGIQRFCPKENRDGATLLSKIEDGDWVIDSNDPAYADAGGKKRHVDDLAEKINDIRATSWTPLGEALYDALGYYTQNSKFCLNCTERDADGYCKDTPGNCLDFMTDDDPVQYWCQDNHILVITEGESTADINASVADFAATPSSHFGPDATDDEKNMTGDDDGDASTGCSDGLYGGTYLDDMTWWGQRALPLYKERYLYDPDGNQNEKNTIYTHLVTTGTLSGNTAGECNPDTLMQGAAVNGGTERYYSGEDPQELEDNLYAVLGDIMTRASSGAAASVISNSRSGDGAIYQALFWPRKDNGILDDKGFEGTVSWVGNVHSLFIDSDNIIYEDTNQNGKLDPDADTDPDKAISLYFSNTVNRVRGCYADLNAENQCPTDPVDNCATGSDCAEIEDIKYLWSANEQLRKMDVLNDRRIFTWNDFNNDGIVDDGGRMDFTVANVSGNTENIGGETFLLKPRTDWTGLVTDADLETAQRGPVVNDFLTLDDYRNFAGSSDNHATDAMNALVTWLQGKDVLDNESTDSDTDDNTWIDRPLRSRHYNFVTKNDDGTTTETQTEWRLGDVINSSPITVNKPAENFHLIYRDPTYKDFVQKWSDRRTVVYFGANDGMLHAVNSGFYSDKDRQFYCSEGYTGEADHGDCGEGEYNLGEELWAYVPYNLQPHLKCLADKFYEHKYFVDLEPRVADVQIFPEDDDHPGGWGTILIGGMRFGGAPVAAEDLNGLDGTGEKIHDQREFSSSYFILDITNPEKPAVLGELTRTTDETYVDLNYTTSSPTIVVMRNAAGESKWYLVMGNGPAEQDGTNTPGVQGKIAVLPLAWLKGTLGGWTEGVPGSSGTKQPIRIPDSLPVASTDGGVFRVPFPNGEKNSASYVSHLISMDYNIDLTAPDNLGARYCTDAVYFGTVDGTDFAKYSDDAVKSIYPGTDISNLGDQWYWDGGGRVYRLVTKHLDITNTKEEDSTPSQWAGSAPSWVPDNDSKNTNNKWPIRMLMDVKSPVTAGPAAGYDEDGKNFWIYVGTGRFYDENDKTDDGRCLNTDCTSRTQRAFFGLKEPIKDGRDLSEPTDVCSDSVMTWGTIDWDITDWGTATNGRDEANTETGFLKKLVPGGKPGQRGLMRTDNILVGADTGYLYCGHLVTQGEGTYKKSWWASDPNDSDNTVCFPGGTIGPIYDETLEQYTFENLQQYIAGTGCKTVDSKLNVTGLDGWYHVFHDPRERNLNSALLFNKKLFFSTYQPYNDKCKAEGGSFLYKLSHTTGTGAWNDLIDPGTDSDLTAGKGSGLSPFGQKGGGFGAGNSSGGGSENIGKLHDFKSPVRGLANVGSAGAAGSGGEFYAEKPDPVKRESNKLNWSDRCGVEE